MVDSHQAHHIIRAFRYQLLQSIQAWIELRGEEQLWLEVHEDFSIMSGDQQEDVQVKHSEAAGGPRPVSLRSSGVQDVIQRYWDRSEGGLRLPYQVRFIARSGAAVERGTPVPNSEPGLVLWHSVANQGDTSALRSLLLDVLVDTPIHAWLESAPTDEELRQRLLQRIRFCLDAKEDTALQGLLEDEVAALYLSKGHYASTAPQGLASLIIRALSAASSPVEEDRRLTVTDLHTTLEEAIPRMGALTTTIRDAPRWNGGYSVSATRVRPNSIERRSTAMSIFARTSGFPLLWIHGGHGVGKSILATLLAQMQGGSWLTCDFRPYAGLEDERGSIAAWRELMFELSQQQPPAGIILDDLSARAVDLLKVRVAGLVELFAGRGGQLIVTSNHSPSAALLTDLGGTQDSAIDSPYFSEDEVRELVASGPAPADELLDAWTKLIHASMSGGHPLLCVAKTAHLRARDWPKDALFEDLGGIPSEAVKETRQEARIRLLADLPSTSARDVLARISTIFASFEDELVLKLCLEDPAIPNGGDTLALLKGSWIESCINGGWRLSPLIADLQGEVPPNEAQRWRQIAAEYWLGKRTLDARTLPLCFWNAYLGKHIWVLLKLGQVVLTLPSEELRGAASLLSPMAALRTDVSLLPEEPMTAAALRVLQVRVGDATENEELVTKASLAWLKELESVPLIVRDLVATVGAMQILDVDQVKTSPVLQLSLLLRLYVSTERATVSDDPEVSELASRLTRELPDGIDVTGMMFAKLLTRIRDSETLEEMINALNGVDDSTRSKLVESAEHLLEGGGIWIHNAWAQEQLADDNLADTYSRYERMHETIGKWNESRLDLEFSVARSVLLDEGLEDRDRAISVIDEAIGRQGPKAALVRQKCKVLRHSGDDASAASLTLQVESDLEELWPFDRMLAFREGAISCGKTGQLEDSIRLFRKAQLALREMGTRQALEVGLTIEQAIVMWRNNDHHGGLSTLADAFEALEGMDAQGSRQAQRTHRYACAMAGLFFHEILDPFDPGMEIGIGDASNLESDDSPDEIALRSLAHNWQILELLEVALGANLGIAERSRRRNGSDRLTFVASLTACARFGTSLVKNDIAAAVAEIQPAITMLSIVRRQRERTTELRQISLDDFSPIGIEELCAEGWKTALQGAVADIMLFNALTDSLDNERMTSIAAAVESQWGDSSIVDPLIAASRGDPVEEAADWPLNASAQVPSLVEEGGLMPTARLARDLYLVYQTANSMARTILEPLVLQRVASGWNYVVENQQFALRSPKRFVPEIEESLESLMTGGIRGARRFFDIAAAAVGVDLPGSWRSFLDQLENLSSGSVQRNQY